MADNSVISNGDSIAADDVGGIKFQRIKLVHGADGTNAGDVAQSNGLPTQLTSLYYPVSTANSSTNQLTAGQSFVGTLDTVLNLQAAQIQVVCDQPYTITINQYEDIAGLKRTSSDSFSLVGGDPFNMNVSLPGNYFNVVVTNRGQATTTGFVLDTTYGIMDTQPRALSAYGGLPVSINDVKGQKLVRCTFAAVVASGVDTNYFTVKSTGTGMAVSQSGGNLVVTTGTTINSETIIRSVEEFDESWIAKAQITLSQRIVNNNFFIEMVDVIGDGLAATASSATVLAVTIPNNPFTSANVGQSMYIGNLAGGLVGVPNRYAIASVSGTTVTFTVAGFTIGSGNVSLFGWNYHHNVYNGTVATNSAYDSQRKGWSSGDTTATINTTASPGHLMVMGVDDGSAFLADQLVASSASIQQSMRASRVVNIADETAVLYLQIRILNGSTAPASTTTLTVGMISVEEYKPIQANITKIKTQAYDAVMPVQLQGSSVAATQSTRATVGSGWYVEPDNLLVADIASAAFTTAGLTNGTAITPTPVGGAAEFNMVVGAVTGTSPTMDVVIQESDDSGTNWYDLYHFPRVTSGTQVLRTPVLPLSGNRIRWNRTVGGTTPSFTIGHNRITHQMVSPPPLRQIYDRVVVNTTLNATTASLLTNAAKNAQLVLNMGAITTTAPAFQLEGSDDNGVTWYALGTPLTGVASATVQVTVNNINSERIRARVSTAGVASTLGYVLLKAFGV